MRTLDLTRLHAGSKVKLRGAPKPQPKKPYPLGWHEVAEVAPPLSFRVVGDDRWLPVTLIEEIVS